MKKHYLFILALLLIITSCQEDDIIDLYLLQKDDITFDMQGNVISSMPEDEITINVTSISDEGIRYLWILDKDTISTEKNLKYVVTEEPGQYELKLNVRHVNDISFDYLFDLRVGYTLKKEDVKIIGNSTDKFVVNIGDLLKLEVESVIDDGITYEWLLDGKTISATKNLEYMVETTGQYALQLNVTQGDLSFNYKFDLTVQFGAITPPSEGATAYITKIFGYMPGIGQHTNQMPSYEEGDTYETMNAKVLDEIGNNNKGAITLGGYGGYVVAGFDHTIQNIEGKRDFRIVGNAFYSYSDPGTPEGGSCEPGIIMVAYDINKNGLPDENEWYEIAGSAHNDPTKELWYQKAVDAGNNVNMYTNYEMTYHRPSKEPEAGDDFKKYIYWEDNKGNSGYKEKNEYHSQSYFPSWFEGDKLTFKGSCLPHNSINEAEAGSEYAYYVLYRFKYGYADNAMNTEDDSAIDISWAVNNKGQSVSLPGIDFIKIYTGVNQESGWLGECSTDITNIEDLHILGVDINSNN